MQLNLADLLKEGEGETLDFKQKITSLDKIAKTICSFANTRGGTILVGVTDRRSLMGIDPEEEKYMLRQAAQNFCNPAINLHFEELEEFEDDKEIVILKVIIAESSEKPHASLNKAGHWQVYIRQRDKSVPAGKSMLRHLRNEQPATAPGGHLDLDKNEHKIMDHLRSHERITVKELAGMINFSARRAQRLLNQMVSKGLIRLFEHEREDYYA